MVRMLASPYTACPFDGLFPIEVAKGLSQLGLLEDFHFLWWESALRLILYYYIKERFIYFFPLTIFSKCIAFHSNWVCIHWNEMYKTKCNRCASVFIHRKWNIQNEVPSVAFFSVHSPEMKCTKPSYRCLHLRRNTLEKNSIYSYTRTLIGQENFPNLRLTDKTFFLANTLMVWWCGMVCRYVMVRYVAEDSVV
jgi:hypothetical protein